MPPVAVRSLLRSSISPSPFGRLRTVTSHQRRTMFNSYLVTPQELNEALKKLPPTNPPTGPRVIPLCASWFLPNDPEGRTGIQVFRKSHIPHSRFFDLDAIKDEDSPYPHMLPTNERFAQAMSELGIRRDDKIVVYDSAELGIFSAPRVGWTLRVFGHPGVHVLNNYKLWVEQGLPTESGDPEPVEKTKYPVPAYETDHVVHFPEMKEIVKENKNGSQSVEVLDARPYGRWAGTDPEPRPGLSSGHMPGSKSLPFQEVLDPKTRTFLPPDQLRKIFEEKGVNPSKTIVTSCGTGVTAAVIETALMVAQYGEPRKRRLYDGSWTEWAQRVPADSGLIEKL
ncbi:hypothetical protein VTN31DRAFT_364 [Thermomyces dupontii]|uniref:uncharacterized protein n=1 Tax=Talaromyces thermophilus TaxID=28565 RepID=UPI003744B17C